MNTTELRHNHLQEDDFQYHCEQLSSLHVLVKSVVTHKLKVTS